MNLCPAQPSPFSSHTLPPPCSPCRDVCDEIRAIVIGAIGHWICALPDNFLADFYLKYVGWALSDKVRTRMYLMPMHSSEPEILVSHLTPHPQASI